MTNYLYRKLQGESTYKKADWQQLADYFFDKFREWNLIDFRGSALPNPLNRLVRTHWGDKKGELGFANLMINNADNNWDTFKIRFINSNDDNNFIKAEIDRKKKHLKLFGSMKDIEMLRKALQGIKDAFELDEDFKLIEYIDGKTVFVIHGRNTEIRDNVFKFLDNIGLNPLDWNEVIAITERGAPYIGETLDAGLSKAQAVLALFTPDEFVELKPEFKKEDDPSDEKGEQSRPNVIFEAGLAFGRRPDKVILVEFGQLRPFSDIFGRHTIRMDDSEDKKKDLVSRLQTVGCEVKTDGKEWLEAGSFEI